MDPQHIRRGSRCWAPWRHLSLGEPDVPGRSRAIAGSERSTGCAGGVAAITIHVPTSGLESLNPGPIYCAMCCAKKERAVCYFR